MRKILSTLLFAVFALVCFAQNPYANQIYLKHRNDSSHVAGWLQLRYDGNTGKLRIENAAGNGWYTPGSTSWGKVPAASNSFYSFNERILIDTTGGTAPLGARGVYIEQGDLTANNSYHFVAARNDGVTVLSQNNSGANIAELDVTATNDANPARIVISGSGSFAGVGYDSDVSSTGTTQFGDRWVPDKGYVDLAIQRESIDISSAEFLSLNSSPKTLIAAPGSGKFIQIISISSSLDYNTTAYATNIAVFFRYGSGGPAINSASWNIAQTADKYFRFSLVSDETGTAVSSFTNQAIVAEANTGDPTDGDGTGKVYISYRIIDL